MEGMPQYLIYPGADTQLRFIYERRRGSIAGVEPYGLPDEGCDLQPSFVVSVNPVERYRFTFTKTRGSSSKLTRLAVQNQGRSEGELLHAYCIAHLRKRSQPAAARTLFLRLWRECTADLLSELPFRWLLSAMTTFADHGDTDRQRLTGTSFSFFFGMLKLYEFERRASEPAPRRIRRYSDVDNPMPLGLEPFSTSRGDLDTTLLARLYGLCEDNDVTGTVGRAIMAHLIADPGTIFARLAKMKEPDVTAYPLFPGG